MPWQAMSPSQGDRGSSLAKPSPACRTFMQPVDLRRAESVPIPPGGFPTMWISDLLTRELSLDWLWERLPHGQGRFDEILDLAHFTIIVNGAVLLIAFF